MKPTLLFASLLLLCHFGFGQQYKQSAGVRLGHTSGFTYKKFIVGEQAVELLLSGRRDGIQFSTLYKWHEPLELSFNENFYFYYGMGAHVGYERYDGLNKVLVATDDFIFERQTYFVIGADAIVGLEYRWLSLPITVGFDVKPYFNYIGFRHMDANFWDASISFKYIF